MAMGFVDEAGRAHSDDLAFFRLLATVMAIVQVTGFAFHFAMGRSSLDAPLFVHAHAVVFMGWVAIFAVQPWLAIAGASGWHRTLGRIAMVWACGLLVFGLLVTWETVRTGRTPFFFQPQHFLTNRRSRTGNRFGAGFLERQIDPKQRTLTRGTFQANMPTH